MNKQAIVNVFKNVGKILKKHSPELLTGIGIAGMVVATVTAVKATPKALQLIEEKESEDGKQMTKSEVVKTTWKCYVPAAITGVCSIGCIIGANSINARRNAALTAAYAISMSDLKSYKEKALEVVGEKKEQAIRDAVAKDKLEQAHVQTREFIPTGRGEVKCYDPLTDRCFLSDIETLRKAENTLNKRLRNEMIISANELFIEIGLDECNLGEKLGWDVDKGDIEFNFSSQLVDGIPYLVLGHNNPPIYIGHR